MVINSIRTKCRNITQMFLRVYKIRHFGELISGYIVSGIFDKEMNCENPKLISGCNIVDSTCRCEHSESCSDESPFNFKTRQECLINLNAMLAQKDEDELNDSADDEGKC